MPDEIILCRDENPVAAARDEPDQAFGSSLIKVNFAGGERRQHHSVSLDVGHLQVDTVFIE